MRGSLRKRGNSWYYRLDLAPINGERNRIERYAGKTKNEAQESLNKAIHEYQMTGTLPVNSNISTHDYLEHWFENYVKVELKLNTQKNYRGMLDKHIHPAIGNYYLKEIKPATLQELLNQKKEIGYAKQTLSIMKGIFNKAFSMAVYPYEFLKTDPSQFVKTPKYDQKEWKDKGDLKIISFDDFKKLQNIVPTHSPYYLAMMISFQTGLRRAEVCGLQWKDIDFDDETLTVEQIMIQDGKKWIMGTPKTQSSYRTINIGPSLLSLLKKAKLRQKENKLFYRDYYTESEFVCTKENGEPVTLNSIKWYTEKYRRESGVDYNFHSFRHTHATMLLENGAKPKEIQVRLGHSRLATTMDTYAHVTKKMKKETVDIFESIMTKEA
ncbi:site-specific integrase [Vagococcus carniphilus]|uniref:tyrosine-type recombinase/integrase n=1 Tax=Vagococcus carniphilus TaxID=218144 RepID=UPI00289211D9|nr:site-specific integrase [Vagococcus carniphilus]MDT2829720.1 site-specific integrase [Vagococcus carniphilus]MDT2839179.1 site-specific integrase [Vagococcus carniphilus]MDT2853237.1 site-specific integrase [Vagococcus carniphilus]